MSTKMNPAKKAIKNYLDERAKNDELFAQCYAKPNKNIDGCFAYIVEQARKMGGSTVCVTDEVVFGWAVHYYDEDSVNPEKEFISSDVSVEVGYSDEPAEELTEKDKQSTREQAMEEYKKQCIAEIKAEEAAKAKKAAEKKKALIEKRKQEESELPTLFNFD